MAQTLPPFQEFLESVRGTSNVQPLVNTLSLLFEPSAVLVNHLAPQLAISYRGSSDSKEVPKNYANVVDQALDLVHNWEWSRKAEFVGGHPRIGEVKGLSAMSAAEQGQSPGISAGGPKPTPTEVLKRLEHLNAVFERRYPRLVYITFVNGRTRAQIKDEMEERLFAEGVLDTKDGIVDLDKVQPHDTDGDVWRDEVTRAVNDVGNIARNRLEKLSIA